ncbi:prepilin-type N-terminal cleavage/methylation domain-containing protein [bacterium]|nr:MAG: prepilin-type N-terminal cleavage/methylation domain-containing protein [bacterium]
MRRGFTLIEIIIVIIIIGILAAVGISQYSAVVEKARWAEAKMVLGTLRSAQIAVYLENGAYVAAISDLGVDAPTTCQSSYYFSYECRPSEVPPYCFGKRCVSGGKTPNWSHRYDVHLWFNGTWGNNWPDGP